MARPQLRPQDYCIQVPKTVSYRSPIMVEIPNICVIGSLNIDFVIFGGHCPAPGETLIARSSSISAGGKGANQAVACARAAFTSKVQQDVHVSMIGAVGRNDPYVLRYLKPTLEASGVDTKYIEDHTDAQTGSATIIVEEDNGAENRILVVPGANHSGMNDIQKILTTVGDQHPPCRVVVMQGEIPRPTVLGLLQHFNKGKRCNGTTYVIFNPAPMFPEGIPLADLADTAVLVMNETEASQMSQWISKFQVSATGQMESQESKIEDVVRQIHEIARVKIVLITLGAKGVFLSTITGRQALVRGEKVDEVVDTTAAGDTFIGYFATQFARFAATGAPLENFDGLIEKVVQNANLAASICVQRKGAMQSIPFAYEIC